MAVRRLEVREARARIEALGAWPERARSAVLAAGALGDPAMVPWLLGRMATPALARAAGEALATMTGVVVEGALTGRAPEGFQSGPTDDPADEDVAMDPDGPLRWPAVQALTAWWGAREGAFRRGVRYVGGVVLSDEALGRELGQASQRRRMGAALEMGLRRPGKGLAEVRGRASRG
jgi:uncharacterized protein (TIGR02270 family)